MKDELVRKLSEELVQEITSERQVVYILAETRKLLERTNAGRNEWTPVWFLCDWALHPALDRSFWARELLKRVDKVVAAGLSWAALPAEEKRFFQENFTMEGIRVSLMEFFKGHFIKPWALGNVYQWREFIKRLAAVVKDCPLILKGGTHIRQVQLDLVQVPNDSMMFNIEWTFRRNDGTIFRWVVPVYFEAPDGHFGRG